MRFTPEAMRAAGRKESDANLFNDMLNQLAAMRVERLLISEMHVRSKVAWKFNVLQQAFVHRLCDLAEPAVDDWMKGRTLAAIILGRALVETVAVLHVSVRTTQALIVAGDIMALDDWAMKLVFGGRYDQWGAEFKSIGVMNALDQLNKEFEGVRDHYETVSEAAHPNSQGLSQFYSDTRTLPKYVDFSARKREPAQVLPSLAASISLVGAAVNLLEELEASLVKIADMQAQPST